MSDSTSWAYALLVVLLASPVLAAVVVLVTTVGQTGSNRVPVQASGGGGQSVAQEVRPVIVMQRVSRGSARRPGSAVDPVGRQVASPATFHERFDRFTSRRREQTRGRRGDPPAGDPDQVPYPSSSWPAVAPPLIETPGVTSPEAVASGGLGREMSPVRSWGRWVRALVETTIPPRHVRPPVGGRQAPVRAIVSEAPEIAARVEGGYVLPPVRVRARLLGTEGSPRAPLILTGIAELDAGANTSRYDGDGQPSSSLVVASNDGHGFELPLVAAAVDQASLIQLSFLMAEPESRDGYVIAEASCDGPTQLSPLPNVVTSVETNWPDAVVSRVPQTEQGPEVPDLVMAVPFEAVTPALVTDAEPLEDGLGSIATPVSMSKPETSIDVFEEAGVAAGEPHDMEMAVEITALDVAVEPVITFVAEALVTDAELLEVDHVCAMPVTEMPVRSVMAEVVAGLVAEAELVDVDVDVDFARVVPGMAIDQIMADATRVQVSETGPAAVKPVHTLPEPELATRPVDSDATAVDVAAVGSAEVQPGTVMSGPEMATRPVDADVPDVDVAETGPAAVEPAYTLPEPELATRPVDADVPDVDVAETEPAAVEPAYTLPEPELAISPVDADVPDVDVAEALLVEVQPGTVMSGPEMAISPVDAGVMEPVTVEPELAEPVYALLVPMRVIALVDSDVPDVDVAEALLVEVQPGTAMSGPEMAIEPVIAEVVDAEVAEAEPPEEQPAAKVSAALMVIKTTEAYKAEQEFAKAVPVEVEPTYAMPGPELAIAPIIADVVEGSVSGQGTGDDLEAVGFENLLVSDAWAAMTPVETVDMVTPFEAGLELEPFVDVPITAFAYEVDGNETDASVSSEGDKRSKVSVPSVHSGAELSLKAMEVLVYGKSAADETDLEVNGLELEEVVGPGFQAPMPIPAPALPVEEPQPTWMPLPRSAKFRWVRTSMLATGVSVPLDVFAGP